MRTRCHILPTLLIALIPLMVFAEEPQDTDKDKGPLSGLEYRLIGPAVGGRVSRVAGVPGDDLTYYAATAAGGVWKSVNGGRTWASIFDLDVEPHLPRVNATGGELNQVWLNLIDNALDAIPESGRIDVSARQELDRVVVRVVDDGPGIPPDIESHIFDAFVTTKPPGQGIGLGLEITRRLVRRYHGDIAVEFRPGRTEFRVSLAMEEPASPSATGEST